MFDEKSKRYFGLAPGKRVRLKYAYIVKHVSTERDASGRASVIHVVYEDDKTAKVKGTLSWLAKVLVQRCAVCCLADHTACLSSLDRKRRCLVSFAC